jgi:hypothetical protein
MRQSVLCRCLLFEKEWTRIGLGSLSPFRSSCHTVSNSVGSQSGLTIPIILSTQGPVLIHRRVEVFPGGKRVKIGPRK